MWTRPYPRKFSEETYMFFNNSNNKEVYFINNVFVIILWWCLFFFNVRGFGSFTRNQKKNENVKGR